MMARIFDKTKQMSSKIIPRRLLRKPQTSYDSLTLNSTLNLECGTHFLKTRTKNSWKSHYSFWSLNCKLNCKLSHRKVKFM